MINKLTTFEFIVCATEIQDAHKNGSLCVVMGEV